MKPSNRNRAKFRPVMIGTNAAKDTIRARLGLNEPGPGYCHFHAKRDLAWYEQLLVERLSLKIKAGKRFTAWECPKGKANEALDCRVYAYAALQGLIHYGLRLNERAEEVLTRWVPPPVVDEARSEGWGDSGGGWIGGGNGSWL